MSQDRYRALNKLGQVCMQAPEAFFHPTAELRTAMGSCERGSVKSNGRHGVTRSVHSSW
jgi:hypothetical protein